MSGGRGTVRVSGLPVDLSENRLVDKIQIHFLRKKNGGGEIARVEISKTTPGTAFITFEEHEVASRLVKQGKQVFTVNDKSYDVTVDLLSDETDPDELFVDMSVTVDHRKLPEGTRTLLSLHKPFTSVQLTFNPKTDLYTLKGGFTEVRALSKLLRASLKSKKQITGDGLALMKMNEPLENNNDPVGMSEAAGIKNVAPGSDESGSRTENSLQNRGLAPPGSDLHQASHEILTEDENTFEDLSIVVDSDIFRYLQKCCNKEYQGILRRHRTEVLDTTSQGITTLYLKPKKSLSECGVSSVKRATQQLAHFYQEKGSQLRKERISKLVLPNKDLKYALESLQLRLPKLMLEEDEENVYLVGSKSDVSEAKQIISQFKGIKADQDAKIDHLFSSSQSRFISSNQAGSGSPEDLTPSDRVSPQGGKLKDPDDLFNPREEHQKECDEKGFFLHSQNEAAPDKEVPSSARRKNCGALEERCIHSDVERMDRAGWYDKDRYTDSLFMPPKHSSLLPSSLDLYKRSSDNPELQEEIPSSEEPASTANSHHPETTANITAKPLKTKQGTSVREPRMAANFKKEVIKSVDRMESSGSVKSSEDEDQKTGLKQSDEGLSGNESRQSPQPHSLPFIKPLMTQAISLKPNATSGSPELDAKGQSGQNIKNLQGLKGDKKKPAKMPTYSSSEPQKHFSLGHLDLGEGEDEDDSSASKKPFRITSPSGSALRRSNSFSGKIKEGHGQDEQTAVDLLFAGQKERSQFTAQTKEVFTVDVPVSLRLWTYLKSVYDTDVDNLTSDLQVQERSGNEGLTLCLRGADSDQVGESHRGLKSLIARIETDFDSRTLPLGMLGLSDCKDKTLVDFCTLMKQTHEKVKIVIMTTAVMILGPRSTCKEVEATMVDFFHTGGKTKDWNQSFKPSTDPFTTDTDTDPKSLSATGHPLPRSESERTSDTYQQPTGPTNKDLSKMSGQTKVYASKNYITGDHKALEAVTKDPQQNQDQDHGQSRMDNDQGTKGGGTQLLSLRLGGNTTVTAAENSFNLETESKAEGMGGGDPRTTPTSPKNSDINSQFKATFAKQVIPGVSGDQVRAVTKPLANVLDVTSASSPSSETGIQGLVLCCACGAQNSTVKQRACGRNFCLHCQKEFHANCKLCPLETNRDAWGIRGKMSVRELTIGLAGFLRYTTLKILYDIPDGIQGEGHPCPGRPFKGDRFEAYLPHNGETKKLLPLLEKAFHRGLTFTVKAGLPEQRDGDGDGRVSWSNIPHKTSIDGGTARNGYPDSAYLRRLTEALRNADLEE